jgi:hypothetical protein
VANGPGPLGQVVAAFDGPQRVLEALKRSHPLAIKRPEPAAGALAARRA